jgi:pantoate--beta-alanine ligase
MSSRNAYLDAAGRATAVILFKALSSVVDHTSKGAGIDETLAHGRKMIQAAGFELQYLEVRHAENLEPVTDSDLQAGNFVVLVAAKLGDVRLIDNIVVRPS